MFFTTLVWLLTTAAFAVGTETKQIRPIQSRGAVAWFV